MSDYFTKLATKALNAAPVLRPRLPSWFGPPGPGGADVFELDAVIDPPAGTQAGQLEIHAPTADRPPDQRPASPLSDISQNKRTAAGTADPPLSEVETQSESSDLLSRAAPAPTAPAVETQAAASVSLNGPQRNFESSFTTSVSNQPTQQKGNDRVSSLRLVEKQSVEKQPAHVPRRVEAPPPSSTNVRAGVARAASRSVASVEAELPRESHPQHSALPAPSSAAPLSEQADSISGIAGEQAVVAGKPAPGLPFPQARLPKSAIARPARAETDSPVVQVTIGRIEVRATPAPQSSRSERPSPQTVSRLEQYLKSRGGGGHE